MTELIWSLEGTETGRQVALWLALLAAFAHALFGALQKGRFDPWTIRGGMDIGYAALALPFALFVVPWPEPHMWPIFFAAFIIHTLYKFIQATAYRRGAFTVVYPMMRGTGALFAVVIAVVWFGERFNPAQWLGLLILLGGIFGFVAYNLRHITVARETLIPAFGLAVVTGAFIAVYTTFDAWAIRQTHDPFTFLAWFFVLDGLVMPLITWRRIVALPKADRRDFATTSILGAIVAYISFGSILIATRIGNVGESAVLRETSTVFAALIGWILLGETTGPRRLALMAMIAGGAVVIKLAG